MRSTSITMLFSFALICQACFSQGQIKGSTLLTDADTASQGRRIINFFIISKPKKGKIDLASRFNILRGKMKGLFRRKKFVAIVARNARHASVKVQRKIKKFDGQIGTLWFDSHGLFKKGHSLFFIGEDEVSYYSLKDSAVAFPLEQMAKFAGGQSKIVIGSCYGGATYYRYSIDYRDITRMNGDSLMFSLGRIFSRSTIYGSESWVMTKPGLFLKRAAVAGFPRRKLFRDICYQPAWERIGKWNSYNARTNQFEMINPVTLDMYGNLMIKSRSFTSKKEVSEDIAKKMSLLRPGLYK